MENQIANNPLLSSDIASFHVDFKKLVPSMFSQAYDYLLEKAQAEIDTTLHISDPSFKELFYHPNYERLTDLHHLLCSLNALIENEEMRKIEEKYSPILSEKITLWSLDKHMFDKIVDFTKTNHFANLSLSRKKMIEKIIKDLKNSGIDLPIKQKRQLAKLNQKLSILTQKFQNNITDAQEQLSFIVKPSELKGLSERAMRNAVNLSKEEDIEDGKLLITESSGLISNVMENCTSFRLKKKIYNHKKRLCTKGKFNNTKLIDKIYRLEQEIATLLGYETYAHMAVEDNMAKTPKIVLEFLDKLGNTAFPYAQKEVEEVNNFGQRILSREPQWWDHDYILDQMKKQNLNIDSEKIRKYFPVEHVLQGLFNFCKEKFDVSFIQNKSRPVWHEDVIFFDVYEGTTLIGGIFIDLYKRPGKTPGAWLDPLANYENNDIAQVKPVALLVCNAPKDIGQKSTFEIDEIVTLFHEMGHALHHLLSKVDEEFFSGFNNVEHDAVELPSQLLENFVYQKDILKKISCHIESNLPISDEMILQIQKSKKFLGATVIISMVRYAEMDMNLYLQKTKHPYELEEESMKKWQISKKVDFQRKRMPVFSHIFGGGYAAGYYAYQWAEVLAADGLDYLTSVQGVEQQDRFDKYKNEILYTGGARSMQDNYIAFTGKPANPEYLIKSYI